MLFFFAPSEMLAWASAQIHCQFHASESRVALPPSDGSKPDVQAENETVFVPNRGERGQCILSTPPKILFCDLRLDPGESKSYSYCETLPVDGPPSFRGQSVKYVYKLTIGCQRVNSPIKLLRVPFRVLVLHGLKNYQFPQDEAVAPSNPFLEEEEGLKKDSRLMDLATELLMVATSRHSLHLYNISNTRGKVGTFCIFKTVYKIGEDVIGTFNFSEGDIPCLQRHFEFVTPGESVGTCMVRGSQSEAVTWTGVEQIQVDTFSWDLPIKVLPTNPILASYVSQFSSTNSISI
ncbi:PREDICTED: RAB6A-GEF complex partner protein 2 [Tinamus guttatus]|uniref:RAB6A-GEF complex partner protein 2 n=1 Tax=Tinamus guttatus TaxID=94827 RepID=UPI00052E9037|nr:PREDICTED: RAB6A-GEF complex partner protein 2 [Tinamus guttatus]